MIKLKQIQKNEEISNRLCSVLVLSLAGLSTLSLLALLSIVPSAHAEYSIITTTSITIPESCSMSGTTDASHFAELVNGTYSGTDYTNGIGQTTLEVYCNDNAGFAIYAIGYTNDEYGNTKLHWSGAGSTSDVTNDISTGIYTSGSTTNSTWSMKLASVAGTYAPTIANGTDDTENFTTWHTVPSDYTKVAYRTTGTDIPVNNVGTGSSLTVTYDAYISATQPAGTYIGQVKYTLVHPNTTNNSNKPVRPLKTGECPNNYICYSPNSDDVEGDMSSLGTTTALTNASPRAGRQYASANSTVTLRAPNFKRSGYGFAGWSTEYNYTSTSTSPIYGPNEDISTNPQDNRGLNVSSGAVLYPVWIAKETNVTMQTFNSSTFATYTSAPNGTIIALEDERDHNVYAIAKLADGKWWMIENLRLDDSATLTATNTHNPLQDANNNVILKTDYTAGTTAAHLAASNSGTWCTSNNAACDDQTMLNTNNTRLSDSSLTASYSANNAASKWYSYGNYYNWYSATAGNGTYSFSTNNNSVTGDLCPAGWHLPKGGDKNNTANSEFWALGVAIVGAEPADTSSYYTGTPEGTNASNAIRAYPNNFVYSGYWNGARAYSRSSYGYYWSSSANNSSYAYYLNLNSSNVYPGTNFYDKYRGYSVRCVAGS